MPPKKKAETKAKPAAKASAKPKAVKAALKPKVPRKTAKTSEKVIPVKAVKAPKAEKAPVVKKVVASKPPIPPSATKKLPKRGETQMVAFIRDPQCIFTYWEVTPESVESVKRQLMDEFQNSSMVLRVFHMDGPDQVHLIREIFVDPHEMNRYIEIDDKNGGYYLEIAQKASSGRTVVYARSNKIMLGFSGQSWPIASGDAKWETPAGLVEYFSQEEYTETFLTPGGISSAESLKRKKGRYASSNLK
jgi:hypothetical protein